MDKSQDSLIFRCIFHDITFGNSSHIRRRMPSLSAHMPNGAMDTLNFILDTLLCPIGHFLPATAKLHQNGIPSSVNCGSSLMGGVTVGRTNLSRANCCHSEAEIT